MHAYAHVPTRIPKHAYTSSYHIQIHMKMEKILVTANLIALIFSYYLAYYKKLPAAALLTESITSLVNGG